MKKLKKIKSNTNNKFHLEFLTIAQKLSWSAFQRHDVLFLIGPAGVGKTLLATAFAISEILQQNKKKIILTRPIVEAGESLGYLPGELENKIEPYMVPFYDNLSILLGYDGEQRDVIEQSLEVAPLAYVRGRTFSDAVCIFDEAQNATFSQLKLFLSRFGKNSKMILTGDPEQSDLKHVRFIDVVRRLETLPGIGIMEFKKDQIVRHPLVGKILERLETDF